MVWREGHFVYYVAILIKPLATLMLPRQPRDQSCHLRLNGLLVVCCWWIYRRPFDGSTHCLLGWCVDRSDTLRWCCHLVHQRCSPQWSDRDGELVCWKPTFHHWLITLYDGDSARRWILNSSGINLLIYRLHCYWRHRKSVYFHFLAFLLFGCHRNVLQAIQFHLWR